MKEMEYTDKRYNFPITLDSGKYNGYSYIIYSLGTHPTAYIGIPLDKKYIKIPYEAMDQYAEVHGGFTYGELGNDEYLPKGLYWIDWDYAHLGDCLGFSGLLDGDFNCKKWTTEEIKIEVFKAIDSIVKEDKRRELL